MKTRMAPLGSPFINGCRCNEITMSTTDEDLIDIVELSLVSVERRKRKEFLIAKI